MPRIARLLRAILVAAVMWTSPRLAAAEEKAFRLPAVDLKQPIIWGAECTSPEGFTLAFGGQNQKSDDGLGHTRIREKGGEWQEIVGELEKGNPLQRFNLPARELREKQKDVLAQARTIYFEGQSVRDVFDGVAKLIRQQGEVELAAGELQSRLGAAAPGLDAELKRRTRDSVELLVAVTYRAREIRELLPEENEVDIRILSHMRQNLTWLDGLVACLAAEPPPRALSSLVYEPKHKVFLLFGGDHLDYLTADTWTFNPASRRWSLLVPKHAPPTRANHTLKATGDGKITLSGGYTYTSNTDYMGGQYRNVSDGPWTYNFETHDWEDAAGNLAPGSSLERTYRTGRLSQEYCWQDPRPNSAEFQATLEKLPENRWVETKTPYRPAMNRDWGTAVLDPQRDLILRFSGGHCAHGGSDVLQFHLATNRWELPIDVEFPLGQLYTNTEYPEGFNFNRRPWVTGHTYQSYGYDVNLKKMIFTGQPKHSYFYDPDRGDWIGTRVEKPKGMAYNDCFYTLTCTSTPQGLFCWTQEGRLFQFDAMATNWTERKLGGEKLAGAVVDNSTMVYDSKRERLLCCRKPYGEKEKYTGEWYAIDLKSNTVSLVSPENKNAAGVIPYLCQIRYDIEHDLLLCGCTLPPGDDGLRRTPAYDCAKNRWVSLRITGDDPSPKGRNVSLGLMYDEKRNLFWAVDTDSRVFVLRVNPETADVKAM